MKKITSIFILVFFQVVCANAATVEKIKGNKFIIKSESESFVVGEVVEINQNGKLIGKAEIMQIKDKRAVCKIISGKVTNGAIVMNQEINFDSEDESPDPEKTNKNDYNKSKYIAWVGANLSSALVGTITSSGTSIDFSQTLSPSMFLGLGYLKFNSGSIGWSTNYSIELNRDQGTISSSVGTVTSSKKMTIHNLDFNMATLRNNLGGKYAYTEVGIVLNYFSGMTIQSPTSPDFLFYGLNMGVAWAKDESWLFAMNINYSFCNKQLGNTSGTENYFNYILKLGYAF